MGDKQMNKIIALKKLASGGMQAPGQLDGQGVLNDKVKHNEAVVAEMKKKPLFRSYGEMVKSRGEPVGFEDMLRYIATRRSASPEGWAGNVLREISKYRNMSVPEKVKRYNDVYRTFFKQ